jgi:hypothetical protein
MTETIADMSKGAALGVKRMAVTICCVGAITFIDYIHIAAAKPFDGNSITAMCLIAALGGVDVWKNGLLNRNPRG